MFSSKMNYEGTFYKLEYDLEGQHRKICESYEAVFLADLREDFLLVFKKISETDEFKNRQRKISEGWVLEILTSETQLEFELKQRI